jgi:hypothetical protein
MLYKENKFCFLSSDQLFETILVLEQRNEKRKIGGFSGDPITLQL